MAATMRAAARSANFAKFLTNRAIYSQNRRTYLTAEYSCEEEWESAKKSDPLLKGIESELKFVEVMRKVNNKSEESLALDFDIFFNTLETDKFSEELGSALNRFRRSKYTIGTLPSTIPAVVRYCLKHGFEDKLVDWLEDRHSYGVFPDTQTLNFMIDHFLTGKMYRNAAKVAVHWMLQEDLGNEISRIMSLIACERYLSAGQNATPWKVEAVVEQEDEEEDDDEIEYVRVPNITNPWFDDHFDITDPNEVIGKALIAFGKASDGIVRDSAILIGLARRQKWDELKEALGKVAEVSKDTKELCLGRLSFSSGADKAGEEQGSNETEDTAEEKSAETASPENPVPEWLEGELSKLKTNSATLLEILEKDAKNLGAVEKEDTQILKANFKEYVEKRQLALTDKNWRVERRQRFEILKQKKKELVEKEELIFAFENWNRIQIILKEVEDQRGEIKEQEKEYIPPEVYARRTPSSAS